MQTRILPKTVAWSGVCLSLIAWAGVAEAGPSEAGVVSVNNAKTNMNGTTYGTSLSPGLYMECEFLGDAWYIPDGLAYCRGHDAQGDYFSCMTEEPALMRAIETMPNYQKLSVYSTGPSGTCTSIYSYRGSRYLPPGVSGGGHPEMEVTESAAWGSLYGARVSADTTQYATCSLYDTPTFSFVSCQAKDVAGDYFYCSSTNPGVLAAVRTMKDYSEVYFYRDIWSGECVEMRTYNGSNGLP